MAGKKGMPAKTEAVFAHLTEAAREMRIVKYGDLADAVGLAAPGLGMQLGYIRDEVCRARGLPWLTAIAVGGKSGLPSVSGFFPDDGCISLKPKTSHDDFRVCWRAMVLAVFAIDCSTVELKPPPATE